MSEEVQVDHTVDATPEQRAMALLHATVWGRVWDKCRSIRDSSYGTSPSAAKTFSDYGTLAMIISGEYRRIANGEKLDK